ncbi:hypothetical protein [Actinoplanes solisilvae]|uniref:hypothetical protein n=1 Tax=Actinoplanes solisilvae TaxID=2486853 RepID=UPI001F0BBE1F|nr:hypothetical protein [Actinoplanes solisilvae]
MNNGGQEIDANEAAEHAKSFGALRTIANQCASGSCPTVFYATGSGTLIVQGYRVWADQAGVEVPEGESLVEIPLDLLAEAVRNLP